MAEYSRMAKGSLLSLGVSTPIALPFVPDFVQLINTFSVNAQTALSVPFSYWDSAMGQGAAAYQVFAATGSPPALGTAFTASNGISTFSAGISLQYGARQQVIGATAANPIVFNVAAHGYAVGDTVIFEGLFQSPTTGMPQICGMPFVISAVADANHFSIVWPGAGSNYTALSGSPAGAYVKKVLYPFLYPPGDGFIEAISLGSTTTVTTTTNHNFVVGQEIAFRIPNLWGTIQLNSNAPSAFPGNVIYYYVTSVVSNTQFVCNAVSSSFTAFNTNLTVASVPGVSFPQVLAVGDINSGGAPYAGGKLYPSPSFPTFSVGVATQNGPAIQGAFVNNTRQGFIIGSAVGGAVGDTIYWRAYLHDYASP